MSYNDELDKNLETNTVVKIGNDFYALKRPDSGLIIDDDYIILDRPSLNGATVDIKRANTPISSFTFILKEYNYRNTSSKIMLDENQFLEKDVIVYLGHITGSFDFSEYIEVTRTKINSVTKISNGYSIKSKEVTNLINKPAFNLESPLKTQIIPLSLTLSIESSVDWPLQGLLKIGSEFMYYNGKSADNQTLLNLTRGAFNTDADNHNVGDEVYLVTYFEEVNPVDMLLQILLSKNGDGANHATYDIFPYGLGISSDKINITDFETIRDNYFIDEYHSLFVWGIDNMLKFLEKNLLPSTNLRFISNLGKIEISLLDQIDYDAPVELLDESSIKGVPTWALTSDNIVNVIEASIDYLPATNKYSTLLTFRDEDSIATFGEKNPLKINMPSVHSTLAGEVIASKTSSRLLSRLATARGKVSLTAHLDASNVSIGDNVQISHRYLPQQGGTLGFSDQLEVMSKTLDLSAALVKYKLEFTSYTGIRIPFIAPSQRIASVISQRKVVLQSALNMQVGYNIKLFKDGALDLNGNPTNGYYLPDDVNTIQSIQGNVVTFEHDFTTTLESNYWLKMADYDNASEEQKARYAFIGSNTGFFNDGSKSYQIIY